MKNDLGIVTGFSIEDLKGLHCEDSSLEKIIEMKNEQIKIIHEKYKELDDECNYLTSLINELRLNFSEVNDFINKLNDKLSENN